MYRNAAPLLARASPAGNLPDTRSWRTAGHTSTIEEPAAVNAAIADFLAGLS